MQTKNTFCRPVGNVQVRHDSPAHTGRLRYAVDFIVPEGTMVSAACDGIVADVKQDSDIGGPEERFDAFGNYIEIEHTNGEYSIYEHLRKNGALVRVGDPVKTGQVIGYSGATGWLAHLGAHLHFDVHVYHEPFGPDDYETLKIRWQEP